MKIFLTGGGDQEYFTQLDKVFLSQLPSDSKILVLPLACEPEDFAGVLERAEECFDHKKVVRINMIRSVSEVTLETLMEYDAVFIEGGNTFKLIKEVRNSHLFEMLKSFVQAGKILYADSAGAIILGSDVHSAFLGEEADEDKAKLQDYRGLGLLGAWAIHCHYGPDDFEPMQELLYANGLPFLALAEPVGVFIHNDVCEVFGEGELHILDFEGHRKVAVGEKIDIDLN